MSKSVIPVDTVLQEKPYAVPRAQTPVDLVLDGNEGAQPPVSLITELAEHDSAVMRNYPDASSLEASLAEGLGVEASQVLVTAGADDAIDRVCRSVLGPGRNMVISVPTFEMIPLFANMTGAEVRRVEFDGPGFEAQTVLDAVDDDTALVVVISPNNPTGVAATTAQIERIINGCPQSLILVDHAYVEFADDDFTARAVEHPNVVITRTFSKAWGLAGLRVGYAVAQKRIIGWLKTAGNPYAVSGPSLVMSQRWLESGQAAVDKFIDQVIDERRQMEELFDEIGATPSRSQANFAFAEVSNGLWWRDAMAGLGIGVRAFPDRPGLEGAIRVACPGSEQKMDRLTKAIRTVAAPEAILFDLDGVFADVSNSYRRAIIETARAFGVEVTDSEITAIKARGNANNDWRVTWELVKSKGGSATLEEVTLCFEEFYQGTDEKPGFWSEEKLLIEAGFLRALQEQGLKLGIVTGRPRRDAERFLAHWEFEKYFSAVICMENGPAKPDPAPVMAAMKELDVERAWFVGDTPDDMQAGRAAGVLPLGIVAPGEEKKLMNDVLLQAGGGRVLDSLDEILEVLR